MGKAQESSSVNVRQYNPAGQEKSPRPSSNLDIQLLRSGCFSRDVTSYFIFQLCLTQYYIFCRLFFNDKQLSSFTPKRSYSNPDLKFLSISYLISLLIFYFAFHSSLDPILVIISVYSFPSASSRYRPLCHNIYLINFVGSFTSHKIPLFKNFLAVLNNFYKLRKILRFHPISNSPIFSLSPTLCIHRAVHQTCSKKSFLLVFQTRLL